LVSSFLTSLSLSSSLSARNVLMEALILIGMEVAKAEMDREISSMWKQISPVSSLSGHEIDYLPLCYPL
jgi:hypothetical protein